jgi:hypothetical protein
MLGIIQIVLIVSGVVLVLSANLFFQSIICETNERLEPSMRFNSQDARPKFYKILATHRTNCPESHMRTVVLALGGVGSACMLTAFLLQFAR